MNSPLYSIDFKAARISFRGIGLTFGGPDDGLFGLVVGIHGKHSRCFGDRLFGVRLAKRSRHPVDVQDGRGHFVTQGLTAVGHQESHDVLGKKQKRNRHHGHAPQHHLVHCHHVKAADRRFCRWWVSSVRHSLLPSVAVGK